MHNVTVRNVWSRYHEIVIRGASGSGMGRRPHLLIMPRGTVDDGAAITNALLGQERAHQA